MFPTFQLHRPSNETEAKGKVFLSQLGALQKEF
jgi:hypothetical protein